MSAKTKNKRTPMQKVFFVVGLVLCIVFAFFLTCNITLIIKGYINPDKPPSVLGLTPMAVLSNSMVGDKADSIEAGDLIFIGKINPSALREGDVIAFMSGKSIITHRIINITEENGTRLFYTKGDANNAADPSPVSESNLIGIFKSSIPHLGDIVLFLWTPLGMFILVGVLALIFLLLDIGRRQKLVDKEVNRQILVESEIEKMKVVKKEFSLEDILAEEGSKENINE